MAADLDLLIAEIAKMAEQAALQFDPATTMIHFTFMHPGYTPEPKNEHMRCSTGMSLAYINSSGRAEPELAGEVIGSAAEHMRNVASWMMKDG